MAEKCLPGSLSQPPGALAPSSKVLGGAAGLRDPDGKASTARASGKSDQSLWTVKS